MNKEMWIWTIFWGAIAVALIWIINKDGIATIENVSLVIGGTFILWWLNCYIEKLTLK